jgi:hypothetical protein
MSKSYYVNAKWAYDPDWQPVTAEDHRRQAIWLLDASEGGDTENRIAAAQVHATLALTAPEEAGVPGGETR